MIYLTLIIALTVGYVIGLLQNGINITSNHVQDDIVPEDYNKSHGIDEFMDYHEKNNGANNF